MTAAKIHFTRDSDAGPCEQGATFRRQLIYLTLVDGIEVPVDLTGMTARMQVRESINATDPMLELTTENGGIVLGGDDGTITLLISAEDTTDLTPTVTTGINARYPVYDLELVNGTEVTRLFEGRFEITAEVTR